MTTKFQPRQSSFSMGASIRPEEFDKLRKQVYLLEHKLDLLLGLLGAQSELAALEASVEAPAPDLQRPSLERLKAAIKAFAATKDDE